MTMKKLFLLSWIALCSLFIVWCASPIAQQDSDEDPFEEKHAQEMEKKDEKEDMLAWETSPTLDLLMPENPVAVVTEMVEYADGVEGFLAYPQDNPQAPGVVVIHEWWGLNDHIKDMAEVLAMQWYRALAVDLYKGNVAADSEEARTLSSGLDQEEATQNLLAAEEYLRQESPKVASLWRCLGGKQSLELSLASESLDATVIYYGRLTDDGETLQNINQPVLGIFAENDWGIPPSAVASFQAGLDSIGKNDYDITVYSGVDHAFANPTGGNYEKEATVDAWNKTLNFLKTNLWADESILDGVDEVIDEDTSSTVEISLTGENFSYSLDEIIVQQWDTVTINFESVGGVHDWVVDEFDAATSVVGVWEPTSVTFVADQQWIFEFYCSVGQHRANWMIGTLIVE